MQVEFSPQRSDDHVRYAFAGDAVTVTFGGVTETYDFTGVPDGEITEIGQGALPQPCLLRASKVAGVLTVKLVITQGPDDRTPAEVRFPNNPYTEAAAVALLDARDAALVVEEPVVEAP